jgi:chloramphenicol 3-O phosphotransferase
MQPGTIIILNGTSSSGKTSLLHGLQNALAETYLEFGLDKFLWMLPKRYLDQPLWDDVLGRADAAGEVGHQLVLSMHQAIRSMADCGMNLLVDHVLVELAWTRDCARLFASYNAYLVGINCDLEILEKRERNRKDRTLGQARKQFDKVHAHGVYDLVVDTGIHTVEENIAQVIDFLSSGQPPKALKTLDNQFLQKDLS